MEGQILERIGSEQLDQNVGFLGLLKFLREKMNLEEKERKLVLDS